MISWLPWFRHGRGMVKQNCLPHGSKEGGREERRRGEGGGEQETEEGHQEKIQLPETLTVTYFL